MEENVIECKNLTHYYGSRLIYENLNFSVKVEGQTGSAILADFIGQYASFSKSWYNGSLNSGMQLVNQTSINVEISGLQDNSPPTPLTSKEIVFQVGINSDKSSSITVDVGIGEIDLNIDVTTPDGARNALTKLDEYLKSINEKQTELGSAYNRLESALETIGISIDNLTSTRSTIRDADIAEESSAYIRYQILQQAATTLMATANQTPSIALQLL